MLAAEEALNMNLETILFWGGLAGMGVFAAIGVLAWVVLRHKKRKLLRLIETEYQ